MNENLNFLKPYLRGWPLIILAMIAGYMIASKYLSYVTPMYESTARMRLADIEEGIPKSNLFKDLDVFATSQKINAEIEMIKSHVLVGKTLSNLDFKTQIFRVGKLRKSELYTDSPILVKPLSISKKIENRPIHFQVDENLGITISDFEGSTQTAGFGDTLNIAGSSILFELNHELVLNKSQITIADEYEFIINSDQKLISDVLGNLDVSTVDKDIAVIRITYKSAHPEKAARLPNALASAYIQDYIETRYGAASVTVDFLDDRINEISNKLTQLEDEILGYRNKKNITNLRQQTETDLRAISQLKIQQTNLKMSLDAIRELEAYIQAGRDNFLELAPNFEAFTDLLSTELVKSIMQLQAEKKDLLLIYTEKEERVQVVDRKLKDLTRYLEESIRNTRRNLEVKHANLSADIQLAELALRDLPEKEKTLTVLNREFEIYQQTYNFLNEKRIEAEIAKAARIAFHRIITPAFESKTPVSPNYTIIKIVAILLAMFGAIMLIFVVHALKARVNDRLTIEKNSMIPLASMVPKMKNQASAEKLFLQLLSQLEVKQLIQKHGITCVNGFRTREGSKYLTQNILKAFGLQKRSVLLIDFHQVIFPHIEKSSEPVQMDDYIWVMNIDREQLKHYSSEQLKQIIIRDAEKFDQVMVLNDMLEGLFALPVMSVANLNLVAVDTRLTPAKNILKVDLMKEEYNLPNMFFALNRVGYNPGIIREAFKCLARMIKTLRRSKKTGKNA